MSLSMTSMLMAAGLMLSTTAVAQDVPEGNIVAIETTKGPVVMELYPDVAPKHVESFKSLIAKDFYDGLTFHRVVPGFVVQGGDPKGDGTGGPGYNLEAEFSDLPHKRGTLAMARSGHPDSAGSQFYIVLDEENVRHLDGQYTIFGQVVRGMENVDNLEKGDKMLELTIVDEEAQ